MAQAEIGSREGAMHDFAELRCTGYTLLVRTQESRYRDLLNALLDDAQ